MQPFFILQAFTLHFHVAEKQQEFMLTLLFHANVTCMRAASDFLFHGARKQPECMLTLLFYANITSMRGGFNPFNSCSRKIAANYNNVTYLCQLYYYETGLQCFLTQHFHVAEKLQEFMLLLFFHANVICMRWRLLTF